MQDKVAMFRDAHARACASGDHALAAACAADLERMGVPIAAPAPMQTATPAPMEKAVPPPKRGGRSKLPRCEHDRIVGRCRDCED